MNHMRLKVGLLKLSRQGVSVGMASMCVHLYVRIQVDGCGCGWVVPEPVMVVPAV